MAKTKYKKMTVKEKKYRAEARKELREKGILPPPKPRLNRKKFAKEVIDEFGDFSLYSDGFYLMKALGNMLPSPKLSYSNVTSEQVGILKVMKLAMEWKKFDKQLKEQGKRTYSTQEFYEKVYKPVADL